MRGVECWYAGQFSSNGSEAFVKALLQRAIVLSESHFVHRVFSFSYFGNDNDDAYLTSCLSQTDFFQQRPRCKYLGRANNKRHG